MPFIFTFIFAQIRRWRSKRSHTAFNADVSNRLAELLPLLERQALVVRIPFPPRPFKDARMSCYRGMVGVGAFKAMRRETDAMSDYVPVCGFVWRECDRVSSFRLASVLASGEMDNMCWGVVVVLLWNRRVASPCFTSTVKATTART